MSARPLQERLARWVSLGREVTLREETDYQLYGSLPTFDCPNCKNAISSSTCGTCGWKLKKYAP